MNTTLTDIEKNIQAQIVRDWSTWSAEKAKTVAVVGLTEEAGEVAGLYKRSLRNLPKDQVRATREHYVEELGDVLWYTVAACLTQGISLEELWEYNKDKLEARYGRIETELDRI